MAQLNFTPTIQQASFTFRKIKSLIKVITQSVIYQTKFLYKSQHCQHFYIVDRCGLISSRKAHMFISKAFLMPYIPLSVYIYMFKVNFL